MPVLRSRLERSVLAGVVVAGVLVLAAGIWALVNQDRIEVWLTGEELVAAQRTAVSVDLPAQLEHDPTRSACDSWTALRCAWSDEAPQSAVELMSGALADAGLDVGDVVCAEEASGSIVTDVLVAEDPVCAAPVDVARDRLWVVATDRTPRGHVPLGRTAVWVTWDESGLSAPMYERLSREWDFVATEEYVAPNADDVAHLLPDRFLPLLEGPCRTESADGCSDWEGPIDLGDLGADPVPALVAELTAAGFFVDGADTDPGEQSVGAHRFLREDAPEGMTVTVRTIDGEFRGQVFTY